MTTEVAYIPYKRGEHLIQVVELGCKYCKTWTRFRLLNGLPQNGEDGSTAFSNFIHEESCPWSDVYTGTIKQSDLDGWATEKIVDAYDYNEYAVEQKRSHKKADEGQEDH